MFVINTDTMAAVEELLRKILKCLDKELVTCPAGPTGCEAQEVVLDLDIEGIHYTLLRVRSLTSQPWVGLSPREKEVIRLICTGLPNKAISDVLEISPWTVSSYLKRIFAKLGVCSRAEMVARVLNDRLLDGQTPASEPSAGEAFSEPPPGMCLTAMNSQPLHATQLPNRSTGCPPEPRRLTEYDRPYAGTRAEEKISSSEGKKHGQIHYAKVIQQT